MKNHALPMRFPAPLGKLPPRSDMCTDEGAKLVRRAWDARADWLFASALKDEAHNKPGPERLMYKERDSLEAELALLLYYRERNGNMLIDGYHQKLRATYRIRMLRKQLERLNSAIYQIETSPA